VPPYIALVVSGGHTSFYNVKSYTEYAFLGGTRDDAAGEAFDKGARMLGFSYPGVVQIEKLSKSGNSAAIAFPRGATDNPLDCSFSGLKSNLAQYLKKNPDYVREDVAASFQEAIVDVLVKRAMAACEMYSADTLALTGGVAANGHLRKRMEEVCVSKGIRLQVPPVKHCTDNAAMIASAGYYMFQAGMLSGLELNAL